MRWRGRPSLRHMGASLIDSSQSALQTLLASEAQGLLMPTQARSPTDCLKPSHGCTHGCLPERLSV